MLSPSQKGEPVQTSPGTSPFEVQASNLMMKLQLMVQELQSKVQEAGHRMVSSIPKTVRDLESLKLEARSLRQELGQIDRQVDIFKQDYSLDVQSLKSLDAVKRRLELSINDLKEANNWSVLTQDLDEILYSKDPQQISQRISNLNRCLQLLKRESDLNVSQTEQVALVGGMQRELRQILAAPLSHALSSHDLKEATTLINLTLEADIPDLLPLLYSQHCQEVLDRKWEELEEADLRDKIQQFFQFLVTFWETELNFSLTCFPSPLQVLCSSLSKSLSKECSLFRQMLLSEFPLESPYKDFTAHFPQLIAIKSNADLFIAHFEGSVLPMLNSESGGPTEEDLSAAQLLWSTLHSPFQPYLLQYLQIGRALTADFLSSTCPAPASQSLELFSEEINTSAQHLTSYLGQQLHTCCSFSGGLLFHELVQLTDSCCEQFCNIWTQRVEGFPLEHKDSSLLGHLFSLLASLGDLSLAVQLKQRELYTSISVSIREVFGEDSLDPLGRICLVPTDSPHYHSLQKVRDSLLELEDSQSLSDICYLTNIALASLNNRAGALLFSSLTHRITQALHQSSLAAAYSEESREAEVRGETPAFDLPPSNFMTEIGDYLLTLPQMIEPFISGESPGLFKSLSELEVEFTETDTNQHFSMKLYAHDNFRHILESVLGMVCLYTQEKYLNSVISVHTLIDCGLTQISTDIVYFKNILSALETEILENLSSLQALVEASTEDLQLQLKESKFPQSFIRILLDIHMNS